MSIPDSIPAHFRRAPSLHRLPMSWVRMLPPLGRAAATVDDYSSAVAAGATPWRICNSDLRAAYFREVTELTAAKRQAQADQGAGS